MKKKITIELDRSKTRWCPDPHQRQRRFKNRKAYTRKPRFKTRDEVFLMGSTNYFPVLHPASLQISMHHHFG